MYIFLKTLLSTLYFSYLFSHKNTQMGIEQKNIIIHAIFNILQNYSSIQSMKNKTFEVKAPYNKGGQMMLLQQHYIHQQKLSKIAAQSPRRNNYSSSQINLIGKHDQAIDYHALQHQITIKNLYKKIIKPKTIHDREKDPNDWFAYPVYFVRETYKKRNHEVQQNNKTKLKKKRRLILSYSYRSEEKKYENGQECIQNQLSKKIIKESIPHLNNFSKNDIQEFADAITRLVFNYTIDTSQKMKYLRNSVMEVLPKEYPFEFKQIVHELFKQIEESLFGLKMN